MESMGNPAVLLEVANQTSLHNWQ